MATKTPTRAKKDLKYPASVTITEPDGMAVTIVTQVYFVGIYCAFYVDGRCVHQGGGHNHQSFVKKYLKDIAAAKARGATVEEGPMKSLNEELARVTPESLR